MSLRAGALSNGTRATRTSSTMLALAARGSAQRRLLATTTAGVRPWVLGGGTATRGPAIVSSRPFSTSPPSRQPPPPPRGPNGQGGSPIGNIFSTASKREAGATLKDNSIDLTALAREGKLDPVVGRDAEITRTLQVLSRRTKNNPVLVGPAGVGKTAIMEALALRLVAGEVPESLKGRRLLSIDLAGLMSGTGVRGSFEEKMKNLIQDLEEEKGGVIAFIDEIYQLLSLGKAEGSLDASNMLKPALARGLQLAGATTGKEFRQIEKDAALTRRFQAVSVDEPSVEEAVTMLRGLKSKYEVHHGVAISDAALVAAAVYSNRYIADRFLPDKAIDLLDEAASTLRLKRESKPEALQSVESRLLRLQIEESSLGKDKDPQSVARREAIEKEVEELKKEQETLFSAWKEERAKSERIRETKEELDRRRFELEDAQRRGDFQLASRLRYGVIPELEAKLPSEAEEQAAKRGDVVGPDEIAAVLARMTGIPAKTLVKGDRSRVLQLEKTLGAAVVGQEAAIQAVSEAVRLARAGLNPPTRPVASFLFLGPTGVGKTELSKKLAQEITGTEKNLININLSEYQEKHSISRLIGAPPGYVGFEDAGQLTEAVRRKPHSIVLFDEFEKAHKDVVNVLLQILDEGSLTDSQGRKVDFRNTVIILTSNIGSDILVRPDATDSSTGRVTASAAAAVLRRVEELYPPELLNRLDSQIVFNSLAPESIAAIVDLRLREIGTALKSLERDVDLLVEAGARDWLAKEGYSPVYGARALNRVVNKHVRQPLASALLKGTIRNGDVARVRLNKAGTGVEVVELHEPEVEQEEA